MVNKQSVVNRKKRAPSWIIKNIENASKNARKIYFIYIGFLAYCTLTVVTTTDRQIILNEAARLPMINVEVPLNGFFIFAPLIAIFIFIYLQLYLQRLKGLIDDVRLNYQRLEKRRLYPWMLNIAEDPEPGKIGTLQKLFVNFSLWWTLPFVLILFAFWFVKKHDPNLSYIVGVIPLVGTYIIFFFKRRFEHAKTQNFFLKISKALLVYMLIIFEIYLLFYIIPKSIEGRLIKVNLSYQILVEEPKDKYKTIYWQNLRNVHLEGANIDSAVLKRADLQFSYLQRAILTNANLAEANLSNANLQNASLLAADLQKAKLIGANLQKADLPMVDLREADLSYSVLKEAYLSNANLKGANLQGADLMGTNFQNAILEYSDLQGALNITVEQLSEASTLHGAKLDKKLMEQIEKNYSYLLNNPKK